ncbi:MAG: hydroxymethylglutaryl-CoA lyase [Acidimicrobiia bacterium]
MADRIEIVEVGPRDGLQNEDVLLSTDQKISLIEHLVASGVKRIEAVSFAHPVYVPQMADAEAVMAGVPRIDGVSYIGLVMNWRGWQRAVDSKVDEANMPIVSTDTFNVKNQGVPTYESIKVLSDVVAQGTEEGIPVSATIAASWGDPFEGEVPVERLVDVAERVAGTGVAEIALADTIGVADPWAVEERVTAVKSVIGDIPMRVHFHDTRNTGIANTYAAIQNGVSVIDASVGGIGGCPFAPAATGNIATDDLVYMLNRAGFDHGVSLDSLIGVSGEMEDALGKPVPAMLPKAGDFPGPLGEEGTSQA